MSVLARKALRPRLLMLTTCASIGGAERVAITVTRELANRDWQVRNVFPLSDTSSDLLAWCHAQGAPAEVNAAVRENHLPHTYRDVLELRRFVRSCRPDIVNLHYGGNHMSLKDLLAVRGAGRHRCVVTVNHPIPLGEHHARMTRLAAQFADTVVVISSATRAVLLDAGVPARKIHLIPCGVPIPPTLPTRTEARARIGVPERPFVITVLARLVRDKNIDILIDAAARVVDLDRELLLVVAGDGPERQALENYARTRLPGRVLFLGRVRDTADVYAASDIFVLASDMEGFGLVYVEAAFYGVPSIGARVGGVSDAIAEGATGLLVPPRDPAALANAIQYLRDDPTLRRRLGAAARTRAYAEFTEARMVDRYMRVYQA